MVKKSISLENYLDFIDSNKRLHLTVGNLNDIISIHGFKKHKGQKNVLVDTVRSMDLMDLRRSTLQEEISSEAFVSLNEAIKDLTHLNWQECCVTSLQTICFSNGVKDSVHRKEKTNASASSVLNMPPMKKQKAPSQQSADVTNEQVDVTEGSVNDEQVGFSGVMCVQSAVGVPKRVMEDYVQEVTKKQHYEKLNWGTKWVPSQQSAGVTNEQVDVTEESVNDEQVAFSGVMCVQSAVQEVTKKQYYEELNWKTKATRTRRASQVVKVERFT
ncbi:uncharacterized protein LOC132638628 isoform X3 [Lycium barbarum]|uniref:uncharacterized protein LOC132638628 isoform X3 n=1 Tax=Lycium barbarum TaxID=112863 RepID=UPI00293EC605|nr:uncharacterized protein LOC132638628 isoform X3 [Lycium barbarum]